MSFCSVCDMELTDLIPNALTRSDLVALLEVARGQMDCVDADEAAGYGINLDQAERLRHAADRALAARARA